LKKRFISIPKDVAERLGIEEGDEAEALRRGRQDRDRAPRDALWLALHGPKVGRVTFEELEESEREQEKLSSAP
jgi:bifunctional DNA-binding transcriptional regulator/antitoxin component of YhaV-PrlF toxin-antitoxin module